MKTLLSLVALFCLPSLVLALPDPDPDMMGIYFDTDYLSAEILAPINTTFMAHVVLSNPTQVAIGGFEFGYDHWVQPGNEGQVLRLSTNFPPGVIIINPPFNPLVGSYSISLPTPLLAAESVVLLSWKYMLVAPNVMHFYLTEAENPSVPGGLPGYWGPDGVVSAGYAATCFGTGSRVNEFCPLPVEHQSWGTLKGLYR
jgi:hypothetical protein